MVSEVTGLESSSKHFNFIDLMQRKPRNPRTGRLTDWKFFFQIYLVREGAAPFQEYLIPVCAVHWLNDVALRNVNVVPVHETTRAWIL
jgi:hypothetical protein